MRLSLCPVAGANDQATAAAARNHARIRLKLMAFTFVFIVIFMQLKRLWPFVAPVASRWRLATRR
jgi:hypothetical protein